MAPDRVVQVNHITASRNNILKRKLSVVTSCSNTTDSESSHILRFFFPRRASFIEQLLNLRCVQRAVNKRNLLFAFIRTIFSPYVHLLGFHFFKVFFLSDKSFFAESVDLLGRILSFVLFTMRLIEEPVFSFSCDCAASCS